jgi:hypothetical protein
MYLWEVASPRKWGEEIERPSLLFERMRERPLLTININTATMYAQPY